MLVVEAEVGRSLNRISIKKLSSSRRLIRAISQKLQQRTRQTSPPWEQRTRKADQSRPQLQPLQTMGGFQPKLPTPSMLQNSTIGQKIII